MRIYCDFDGTISTRDTTDHVLERLAPPQWRELEADWVAGRISAAECLSRQIALLDVATGQLDAVLDEVGIAPGFVQFADWCKRRSLPLTVVSDGVDYFIHRILDRHGLGGLPVIANRLAATAPARRLEQPWRRADCAAASGVCKCAVTDSGRSTLVYIGDGRSDFCVAKRADLLFAKDALARHARERGIAFQPWNDFHQVRQLIAPLFDAWLARRGAARRPLTGESLAQT